MVDKLIDKIIEYKNPVCAGLDTRIEYVPRDFIVDRYTTNALAYATSNIYRYNCELIDCLADIVPCVKVQVAYYEMYGLEGMAAFRDTIAYAKKAGMYVIADIKRNDIGATAEAYSAAYLGKTKILDEEISAFDADFVTVNGYLGSDGLHPFVEDCKRYDKGMFVLVKTSNKSSGELQDLECEGKPVYEHMADLVDTLGEDVIGKYGYSDVGAVVGATYPRQAESIRKNHPHLFILVPGYGAQGATADDIAPNFDKNGLGGIVNNSRALLTAHSNPAYKGMPFDKAARKAALDMRDDIGRAFERRGIDFSGKPEGGGK